MYDPKTKSWDWRAGYDYATEKHKTELDRLRTLVKEMRMMLMNVRMELKAHEVDKTGETYNNVELNALIAKTAKEGE